MGVKDKQPVKRKMKRRYVDGDGNEHFVDVIEVNLSKGSLEDLIENAIDVEEDDRQITNKATEIRNFLKTSKNMDTLERWYELGKKLQFVDNLRLKDEQSRNEAFKRLFGDFEVDKTRNPADPEIVRYPLHMYELSKIPKDYVFFKGMTWSRWFDILEYKLVWNDSKLLKQIVEDCCKNNWNRKRLRKHMQSLNRQIKEQNK